MHIKPGLNPSNFLELLLRAVAKHKVDWQGLSDALWLHYGFSVPYELKPLSPVSSHSIHPQHSPTVPLPLYIN
jgi:hypothetical protein